MEQHLIFMIIAGFALTLISYFIPKKLKRYEIYTTSTFALLVGLIVDMILAVKYKFYVLGEEGVQFAPLIGQVIFYSTSSSIILNTFPYNKPIKYKLVYIICSSIFSVIFEAIAFKFGFIKYNEWKIWYSALCYPFIISFFIFHFKFYQWMVKRSLK